MDIAMRNAQPIRRQDLYDDGDSSADDDGYAGAEGGDAAAAARATLEAIMARTLGLDFGPRTTPATAAPPTSQPEAKGADESGSVATAESAHEAEKPAAADGVEFAFRLFSSSRSKAAVSEPAVPTVILYDDVVLTGDGLDPAAGAGGLASAPRPLSAYVAGEPTAAALARCAQTAVSGEAIVAQAAAGRRNAWGLEVPWRARTTVRVSQSELRALLANALPDEQTTALPLLAAQAANRLPPWALPSTPSATSPSVPLADRAASRKRPGKKRRIVLRQREKARLEEEAAAKLLHKSKDEHLLEKKKRLNRLKKLRRREKKREERKAGGDDGNDSDSSDGTDT